MKKKALYNSCPDCREKVLWMPYEDRCGKCGFGGKPKTSTVKDAPEKHRWDVWDTITLLAVVGVCLVFGFLALKFLG
jgi:ribosomal protein S27AE